MIAYKGQHTIHKMGGQIYWESDSGAIEGVDNGFALFSSKNLLGENQKTRFSIRFGLNGTQEYQIKDRVLQVNQQQFLVMNAGTEYNVKAQNGEDTTMLAFCFNEDFVSDFVSSHSSSDEDLIDRNGIYDLIETSPEFPLHTLLVDEEVKPVIRDIIHAKLYLSADEVDNYSIFNRILEMVFADCSAQLHNLENQKIVKQSTKVELYKRLSIARDYIQAHYCEEINLNELSRVACLSPYHFHRAFKRTFGITPKKYVTALRIERAKWLLKNRDSNVQSVCNEIGFKDVSSFTRLFSSYTKATPSAYRNQLSSVYAISA
ncbi:MAG: helix-turn-helix transcriptional regulator [Roseivirga sp.]|uniref:AraC family transcriptional regulator n=1 Tax=Roseivirga sp. TaxID=1964215 RepID=UPI001AFD67C0|nr:AraC family transcriptional regulator [Roseivirga sp.]MBO6662262.1 helix-turn-helix transcriptional regulator [Roseivirga sp.]MBO6762981.1 helix-turn-helix transcriptional regulator [Roseivirga sp.]